MVDSHLRERGVVLEIVNDETMIAFFRDWKARHPDIWNGDIGAG